VTSVRSGGNAWAVLRLRNEASLLRERKRQVQDYGYLSHELASLSDAAAAADRMAASIQAGDRRSIPQNRAEFDKFINQAGWAAPLGRNYGRRPGHNPVDEIAATWEADQSTHGESSEEDRRRAQGERHKVRGFERVVEGRRERVRPHLAKNPRRQ
jgi:hypothetical protein